MKYYYIYETTNLINGMVYRGCHSTDYFDDGYIGSGIYFKRAVSKYGKENFEKKILCFCKDREEMSLKESEYITSNWVDNDDNYNLQSGGLNNGVLCKDSKDKISRSLKDGYKNGTIKPSKGSKGYKQTEKVKKRISESLKKRYSNQEHHLKGKAPWNKGKINTHSMSEDTRKKISKSSSEFWKNEDNRSRLSETLKEKYSNQEHHLKGKAPWNKGLKFGPSWNKGKKDIILECPHCGRKGGRSNMKRWHFDNCKYNKCF